MKDNAHISCATALPSIDSPFSDAAAVDAWDAWFRWRDCGILRDLTVDATWHRVARALVSVESVTDAPVWERHFMDAFTTWRLLLDERILATAGTSIPNWATGKPVAVLNVAAFVRTCQLARPTFDQDHFETIAALAVRALDNAALVAGSNAMIKAGFRIGVTGFAKALALLGLEYNSVEALALATLTARTLAQGCLKGSLQLARERGAYANKNPEWRSQMRELALNMLHKYGDCGMRHGGLTAITAQRKLSLLANNVSDGLSPLSTDVRLQDATMQRKQSGVLAHSRISIVDQLKLRAAMQHWIDEPIAYPQVEHGHSRNKVWRNRAH